MKILHTLFARLTLGVLLIFIIITTLLVSSIDNSARLLQQEAAQKLHLDLAKNLLKEAPVWQGSDINTAGLEQAFHTMMILGPGNELYLISPEGNLLAYSDPDGQIQRQQINMQPILDFLADNTMLPVIGDDPRSANGQKIFSVAPVYQSDNNLSPNPSSPIAGYLYIIIGGEQYDSVLNMLSSSHFAQLGISSIAAGGIFLTLVIILLFFFITRPLQKLATGLQHFRELHFLQVPESLPKGDSTSHDELDQVMSIIHSMAEKIVGQFQEMIHHRNLRQELITHISHDLRTPLASIRGYLDSWQLSQKNPDPESTHCVNVALQNCDQLEHMVEELFELSRLESQDIQPQKERFNLQELADDIIQKFSPRAKAKEIQLLCQSPDRLPDVFADLAHINRVFSNLLDNAIRHSKVNSQILISLSIAQDTDLNKIEVKIADSGSGIPAHEIPLLFEPYFRASNQERQYPQGTGLGLAITKRLLRLHDADIKVESTENMGSVFSFSLAIS